MLNSSVGSFTRQMSLQPFDSCCRRFCTRGAESNRAVMDIFREFSNIASVKLSDKGFYGFSSAHYVKPMVSLCLPRLRLPNARRYFISAASDIFDDFCKLMEYWFSEKQPGVTDTPAGIAGKCRKCVPKIVSVAATLVLKH